MGRAQRRHHGTVRPRPAAVQEHRMERVRRQEISLDAKQRRVYGRPVDAAHCEDPEPAVERDGSHGTPPKDRVRRKASCHVVHGKAAFGVRPGCGPHRAMPASKPALSRPLFKRSRVPHCGENGAHPRPQQDSIQRRFGLCLQEPGALLLRKRVAAQSRTCKRVHQRRVCAGRGLHPKAVWPEAGEQRRRYAAKSTRKTRCIYQRITRRFARGRTRRFICCGYFGACACNTGNFGRGGYTENRQRGTFRIEENCKLGRGEGRLHQNARRHA